MEFNGDKVKYINIAYIGGGSLGWAWTLIGDLANEERISGNIRLYDIDYEAAMDNEKIGNSLYNRFDVKGKWRYKAVKKIEEALINADFVIISIMCGSYKEMESDVHLPEKYGIYQAVGDTVGPGGLMRAIRTIPVYMEFAMLIKKYCPDAWIINYSNPMTICTRTLYEAFPEIKAFGCCHEVFSTQILLTDVLSEISGIKNVPREEVIVNVMGINHFTWIDRASYKGIDIIPLYKEFVEKHFKDGYWDSRQKIRDKEEAVYFGCANLVKFDLYKRYGIIAASGDRHLAEFVPSSWYLKDPETVKKWKYGLTPVSYRIKKSKQKSEMRKKLLNGKEKFDIKKSGEEGVNQIKALLGIGDLVTNVNLPNKGQLEGFQENAVVETNALFSKNRIQPVLAGKLPDEIKDLIIRHVYNQEIILNASIKKDKNLAFNAFINDPLVNISIDDAGKLFEKMLENIREYLPEWNI